MGDRRMIGSIGWLSGGSLATRGAAAASAVITARALGVEGRGTLAVLFTIGMIAGAFVPSGLEVWTVRALSRDVGLQDVQRLVYRHVAVASVVLVLAGFLVGASLGSPGLGLLTGGLCVAQTGSSVRLGMLHGLNDLRRYSIAGFAGVVATLAVVAALAVAKSASVETFLIAAIVGQTLVSVWPIESRGRPDTRASSEQHQTQVSLRYVDAIRFGLPTAIGGLVAMLLYRVDVLLVSAFGNEGMAGVYSVSLAVTEIIWVLPTAVAQALLPRSASGGSPHDTARVCRISFAATLAVAVAVAALSPLLIPMIFGADFAAAADIVWLLGIGALAIGVWKIVGHDLLARGVARPRLVSGLAGLLVMTCVSAIAVPHWGLAGAAFASTAGSVVPMAIVVRIWSSSGHTRAASLFILQRADLARIWERRAGVQGER